MQVYGNDAGTGIRSKAPWIISMFGIADFESSANPKEKIGKELAEVEDNYPDEPVLGLVLLCCLH